MQMKLGLSMKIKNKEMQKIFRALSEDNQKALLQMAEQAETAALTEEQRMLLLKWDRLEEEHRVLLFRILDAITARPEEETE